MTLRSLLVEGEIGWSADEASENDLEVQRSVSMEVQRSADEEQEGEEQGSADGPLLKVAS